jgi:hypothetical protein
VFVMPAHLQQVVHCKVPVPAEQLLEDNEVAMLTLQREGSAPPAGAAVAAGSSNLQVKAAATHHSASTTDLGATETPLMHDYRKIADF